MALTPVTWYFREIDARTQFIGNGPSKCYSPIGPSTRDTLANKTITNVSNNVAVSHLTIGDDTFVIGSGSVDSDVLTITPDGVEFQTIGGVPLGTNTPYGAALLGITSGEFNSAFGSDTSPNITTANYNSAIGFESLYYNNDGAYNTAAGSRSIGTHPVADTAIISYENNTGVGSHSMMLHKIGSYNAAVGTSCMRGVIPAAIAPAQITQDNNAAIGNEAGSSWRLAINNSIAGRDAMKAAGEVTSNCAIGYQSIMCPEPHSGTNIAERNAAFGRNALSGETSPVTVALRDNCAFGYQAILDPGADLGDTCAFGSQTCLVAAAGGQSAVGRGALRAVTTGAFNVAIGKDAGMIMDIGNLNVCIGVSSGDGITDGTRCTTIGFDSDCAGGTIAVGAYATSVTPGELTIASAVVPLNSSATATAGAAAALPATCALFIDVNINGTAYKMPAFAM